MVRSINSSRVTFQTERTRRMRAAAAVMQEQKPCPSRVSRPPTESAPPSRPRGGGAPTTYRPCRVRGYRRPIANAGRPGRAANVAAWKKKSGAPCEYRSCRRTNYVKRVPCGRRRRRLRRRSFCFARPIVSFVCFPFFFPLLWACDPRRGDETENGLVRTDRTVPYSTSTCDCEVRLLRWRRWSLLCATMGRILRIQVKNIIINNYSNNQLFFKKKKKINKIIFTL